MAELEFPVQGKPLIYTSPVLPYPHSVHTGWIYRYYDVHGRLIYIGQTTSADGGRQRWHRHYSDHKKPGFEWADSVARIFVVPVYDVDPALPEGQAIASEKPPANFRLDARHRAEGLFDTYQRLDLRSFMGRAYREGLQWIPGWVCSRAMPYIADPWVLDLDDDPTSINPLSVITAHMRTDLHMRTLSDYSRSVYLGALSDPALVEIEQGAA